jgi:hypothetical protein
LAVAVLAVPILLIVVLLVQILFSLLLLQKVAVVERGRVLAWLEWSAALVAVELELTTQVEQEQPIKDMQVVAELHQPTLVLVAAAEQVL